MSTVKQLAPCGTYAAVQRHYKRGEPLCEPCKQTSRDRQRARYIPRQPRHPANTCSAEGCVQPARSKYCTARCRNRTNGRTFIARHTCEVCGQHFTSSRGRSRVCSLACRDWINPQVRMSWPVPITHPAHRDYWPHKVDLVHPGRGQWHPVTWDACSWCDRLLVVKPSTRHLMGQLHCSLACTRRRGKAVRRAREHDAAGCFTWTELMRVFLASGRRCSYCDEQMDIQPEPDHVIPLSRGGSNSISNVVPTCHVCNGDKSDNSLTEWEASRARRGLPPRRYVLTGPRFAYLALGPIAVRRQRSA